MQSFIYHFKLVSNKSSACGIDTEDLENAAHLAGGRDCGVKERFGEKNRGNWR